MYELTEDNFYKAIEAYGDCCLEYCLMKDDQPYRGEVSHRAAVLFAMEKCSSLMPEPWTADIARAEAALIGADELLRVPDRPWKHNDHGTVLYDVCFDGKRIPYWYAFLEPPHGTGPVVKDGKTVRSKYGPEDFRTVNEALFPEGTEQLTVYEWPTDWSDYFDDGNEWWGAGCWSVYDAKLDRYAVILASSTD